MSLKAKLDTLEGLPKEIHDMYEEQDGKFVLKIDGMVPADDVEDVGGLKSALQKEREARREADKKLKTMSDKLEQFDPEKYNELLEKERAAEEETALKAGEFEKLKEQMRTQHAENLGAKDKEIARMRGQIEAVQIDSAVVEAISKAGGNVELLKPHVRSRLQLDPDSFTTVVLDSDGKTPKVDADGNPVNIDTLIGEMRKSDTYASAFKATEQSGGGSEPGTGGSGEGGSGTGGTPKLKTEGLTRSTMTDRQKIDFQRANGLEALLDLPE